MTPQGDIVERTRPLKHAPCSIVMGAVQPATLAASLALLLCVCQLQSNRAEPGP